LTQEGGRALTPEYAAPEQVTGGAITTATDVFALGTLLYVLLAGRHPAEVALRSPAGLLKAIIETDPRRPSDSSDLRDSAALRSTSPDALRRLLKGDLDTIVAKALKKKPEERYSSVAAFADDIRRFLSHQPISTRPDTIGYRAGKFLQRNRTPVALSALAVVALVSGLVGTFTQARRAQRQAALAEAQRRQAGEQRDFAVSQLLRAEAINDLNAFLLSDAAPSGKPFTVGDLLSRAERVVAAERGAADENRVEILMAIGSQYWSQDEDENARRVLGRAYELSRRLPNRPLQAKAACTLAIAVVRAGEADRAEALIQEGLAGLPTQPQFTLDRVGCLWRGSYVAREAGDEKAGVERVQAARSVLRDSGLAYPLLDLRVAMEEAETYRMASRHLEANAAFERAALGLAALGRDDTQTAGTLFNNWGLTLDLIGQPLKAESIFRRAIRISADGTERTVSPMLLNNLARTLGELLRLAEAQGYADRAYARARQAGDEVVVNQSLLVRASLYRQLADLERAAKMLAEVEPRLTRMLPRGHWAFGSLASQKALLAQARGDFAAAKVAADRAVAIAETSQREDFLQLVLLRRAELELQMLLWDQARADAARALVTWPAVRQPGIFSSRVGRCNMALGRALRAQGKPDEALVAFASAIEHLQPSLGPDHPEMREARRLAASAVSH
jgi:serine/threonine-protein kinase